MEIAEPLVSKEQLCARTPGTGITPGFYRREGEYVCHSQRVCNGYSKTF